MTAASRTIAELQAVVRGRTGVESLPAHLQDRYGIRVTALTSLDAGVFRVERSAGPAWVARRFPAARPLEQVEGDAAILQFLEAQGYPAERCACPEPVSVHAGQGVLVTELVPGDPLTDAGEATFRALGDLLGRLHTLPEGTGAVSREAGALHVYCLDEGSLRDELDGARAWLAEAEPRVAGEHRAAYETLLEQMPAIDLGEGLPQALIHPDLVHKNVIARAEGGLVPIDWTGAGRGPRAVSLGFLLMSAVAHGGWKPAAPQVDAVIAGYRKHLQLTNEELARMEAAMPVRALIFDCYMFALGRTDFEEVTGGFAVISRLARAVVARVRDAFQAGQGAGSSHHLRSPGCASVR